MAERLTKFVQVGFEEIDLYDFSGLFEEIAKSDARAEQDRRDRQLFKDRVLNLHDRAQTLLIPKQGEIPILSQPNQIHLDPHRVTRAVPYQATPDSPVVNLRVADLVQVNNDQLTGRLRRFETYGAAIESFTAQDESDLRFIFRFMPHMVMDWEGKPIKLGAPNYPALSYASRMLEYLWEELIVQGPQFEPTSTTQ